MKFILLISNCVVLHFYSSSFLGAFFFKIAKIEYYLCDSCLSTWNNSAPTGQISLKSDILYIFQKFIFYQNLARITGTLPEDVCTVKWYLVELFLEWEMFQTKVLDAFSMYIARSVTIFKMMWENTVETGRLIFDKIVQCMCFACWII